MESRFYLINFLNLVEKLSTWFACGLTGCPQRDAGLFALLRFASTANRFPAAIHHEFRCLADLKRKDRRLVLTATTQRGRLLATTDAMSVSQIQALVLF
jgi:hypothetical protein